MHFLHHICVYLISVMIMLYKCIMCLQHLVCQFLFHCFYIKKYVLILFCLKSCLIKSHGVQVKFRKKKTRKKNEGKNKKYCLTCTLLSNVTSRVECRLQLFAVTSMQNKKWKKICKRFAKIKSYCNTLIKILVCWYGSFDCKSCCHFFLSHMVWVWYS